jgi:hypothetical protein
MDAPRPHACCSVSSNLAVVEKRSISGKFANGASANGDLLVKQCQVCNAKHYNVAVDPIEMKTT